MILFIFFIILILVVILGFTGDDISEAFIKGGSAILIIILTVFLCCQVEKETNYANSIIQKYKKGEYTIEIRVDKEKIDTIYIVK